MVAQLDGSFIRLGKGRACTRLISYLFYEGRPLTTRGRFINPLLKALFFLQVKLAPHRRIEEPIYIVGLGRSGTTVLGTTLGIHREVGFLNEPKAMWSYLFPAEDLIGSYREDAAHYVLDGGQVDNRLRREAGRLFGAYLFFSGSRRLVDKYPEMLFRADFLRALFPDARIIFLHRNGWDVCRSIDAWSDEKGVSENGVRIDWWGRDDRKWRYLCEQVVASDDTLGEHVEKISRYVDQRHRAAVEWIVSMKRGLELAEEPGVLSLAYSDYVSSDLVRREVLEFCRLPADASFDQYCSVVLEKRESHAGFDLPAEISGEFHRVMECLDYE